MNLKIFEDNFREKSTTGFIIEQYSYIELKRGYLEFGDGNYHRNDAIAKINVNKIKNFQIRVDLKMVDDLGNPTWWFGIKARSINEKLTDGYLIYIRSNGNVAIYTGGSDISVNQITSPIKNRKITFIIKLVDNKFTIKVENNEFIYSDPDKRVLRDGFLYLYANHTKNRLYCVNVWKVINIKGIFRLVFWNKSIIFFYLLIILLIVVYLIYLYNPKLIENLLDSKVFQFWTAIK